MITLHDITQDAELMAYVDAANAQLAALGYTEHGRRHAGVVARVAADILAQLDYSETETELARVAGFLHDIGNLVHREAHALSGAVIALQALRRLGMAPADAALVAGAIGNHEEERGVPVSVVAAAVVLADKADVHRSRVQNPDPAQFDIHDQVNYAATLSRVEVDAAAHLITLRLVIDTNHASVMNYFEIFLSRMVMMRRAAEVLGCTYQLLINDVRLS